MVNVKFHLMPYRTWLEAFPDLRTAPSRLPARDTEMKPRVNLVYLFAFAT